MRGAGLLAMAGLGASRAAGGTRALALGAMILLLAGCGQKVSVPAAAIPVVPPHPDLSGFWNLDVKIPRDEELMGKVAPNTVFLDDTGPVEFPAGQYGGLILTPEAIEAARKWSPYDQLTTQNACKPPSIVYSMQGPFPIEIFQSDTLIVMKLEYYDLVRIIFLDGRKAEADYPNSKVGFSSGHWDGSTLVVETTHLEASTITNNGLDHSDGIRVIERFKLGADGKTLLSTQEFEDPAVIKNRGVRFIAWRKEPGQHVFPYECDPGFAGNYAPPAGGKAAGAKARKGGGASPH
ncbi:MAG TPA: hypothetical protein VGM84_15930 [Steroidobacteraceae bacterium]|jgi:hypothetical protein